MTEEEVVVPFRGDPDHQPAAKRIRSTLIASSMDALRRRGLMERYEAVVDAEHKSALLSCVAGVWLPMNVGLAHYRACDGLGLSPEEIEDIGQDVSVRVQASFLSTLAKMARSAGVTPWTGLAQFQRLWDRVLDGGGVAVYRTGPKDARIEIVALPLVDIPYFHDAFRAFIVISSVIFAVKAYGKDVPGSRGHGRTAYKVSWA